MSHKLFNIRTQLEWKIFLKDITLLVCENINQNTSRMCIIKYITELNIQDKTITFNQGGNVLKPITFSQWVNGQIIALT